MTGSYTNSFRSYVCEGDTITAESEGFEIVARIVRDDCRDTPDERNCGFWPSKDKNAAGYVLPENYQEEMEWAEKVMADWKNDEWFYTGVVLSVSRNGVMLDNHAASLWGIECNYPARKNNEPNAYLTEVAEDLLSEAVARGKEIVAKLTA